MYVCMYVCMYLRFNIASLQKYFSATRHGRDVRGGKGRLGKNVWMM